MHHNQTLRLGVSEKDPKTGMGGGGGGMEKLGGGGRESYFVFRWENDRNKTSATTTRLFQFFSESCSANGLVHMQLRGVRSTALGLVMASRGMKLF